MHGNLMHGSADWGPRSGGEQDLQQLLHGLAPPARAVVVEAEPAWAQEAGEHAAVPRMLQERVNVDNPQNLHTVTDPNHLAPVFRCHRYTHMLKNLVQHI